MARPWGRGTAVLPLHRFQIQNGHEQIPSNFAEGACRGQVPTKQEGEHTLSAQRAVGALPCRPARHLRGARHSTQEVKERAAAIHAG